MKSNIGLRCEKTCIRLSLGVCEQLRLRPVCASSVWSVPLLFTYWKVSNLNLLQTNFLSSLCSWGDWFEYRSVWNPEDGFVASRPIHKVPIITVADKTSMTSFWGIKLGISCKLTVGTWFTGIIKSDQPITKEKNPIKLKSSANYIYFEGCFHLIHFIGGGFLVCLI